MITAIDTPALSDGAERFLATLSEHGMHNQCVAAARRMPLKVRVTWTAQDGSHGELDCIAFSVCDAIKQQLIRMPSAKIMARVIGRGRV